MKVQVAKVKSEDIVGWVVGHRCRVGWRVWDIEHWVSRASIQRSVERREWNIMHRYAEMLVAGEMGNKLTSNSLSLRLLLVQQNATEWRLCVYVPKSIYYSFSLAVLNSKDPSSIASKNKTIHHYDWIITFNLGNNFCKGVNTVNSHS